MEFWQYTGQPLTAEIEQLKQFDKENYDHLAIRPECYRCGSKNTMWLRQEWSVCFNCLTSFTLSEYQDYMCFIEEERDKLIEDSEWEW